MRFDLILKKMKISSLKKKEMDNAVALFTKHLNKKSNPYVMIAIEMKRVEKK